MKINLLSLTIYSFCLLVLGCSTEGKHPTGVYMSVCGRQDGSQYNRIKIFHVKEDSITISQLNDFIYASPNQGIIIPSSVFTTPYYYEYEPGFSDTTIASITAEELTIKSSGISNEVMVAKRLEGVNSGEVYLINNTLVANKVFERWSDRSRWIFSADNRLEVRSYDNKALYKFERDQFYTIDSFANSRFLNIHTNDLKYSIDAVNKSYIALKRVGCAPIHDTLRFKRDTIIESILPPAAALAERPEYAPKRYSTYWYETLWTFTFMNNGTFKYLPDGHFSAGYLYTGTYEERDGVIELDFTESDFADMRAAYDPVRLFRLDADHLRWPNGALLFNDINEPENWENLFHEFVDVCSRMVAENKFGVANDPYPYISAEIIAINPETMIRFKPSIRRNSKIAPNQADTLSLTEIRKRYPYKAPEY